MENFDQQYSFPGDALDKKTKTKMKGFYDQEKVDEWRQTMENVFKRRLQKRKEKNDDDCYFTIKRASNPNLQKISRESLSMFEKLNEDTKVDKSS